MSKNRIKVPALKVPATRAEMEELAGRIAQLKIEVQSITASMDRQIANIREALAPGLGELESQIAAAMESARAWADANPGEFGKAKSIDMTQAVIGFRTGQPQLKRLSGWTWDRVMEKLRTPGWSAFIRSTEEIDKQALLNERKTIGADRLREAGVRVVQEETFFVEPKLTDVETRETVPSQS